MPIEVTASDSPINVSASGTKIDAAVSGGQGPQGSSGVVTVSAPLVNSGTSSAASLSLAIGTGLEVSGGQLRLPASGVVAGSYSTVTVDATGRVTAGSTHAVAWNDVSGKPSTFTPSVHGHGGADITIGDGDDNTTTLSDGSAAAIFLYTINDADYIDGFQLLLSGNGGIIPGTFLPTATANALGGVKIGSGVTITDGVISVSTNYAAASHTHAPADISFAATDRLLGRSSSGAGAGQEIVCTSAGRALLDDADAAAQRTTLGLVAIASSGSASDLTAGTVATARLGSGTANSTTFLRGDGTWATAGSSSASDLTSGTLADARLSTTARQAVEQFIHPFLLAGM